MLKIGINALYIKWGRNGGTETYLTNIVRPWYESERQNYKFTLYCNSVPPWWDGDKVNFNIRVMPIASCILGRVFIEQIYFPFLLTENLDMLFNPGYVGSYFYRARQTITIHDAFAWIFPKEIGVLRNIYWKVAIPLCAKKATSVIAVSNSTAIDIRKYCGIAEDKVKVIFEAGEQLIGVEPDYRILSKYNLKPKSFFHCVGFFKKIKNPERILEAFNKYIINSSNIECKKLVLVGLVEGEFGKKLLEKTQKLPNVVVVGRITDRELAALYRASAGLIFPSLYEGFGIPILEAQSLECPVLTSNISSMPEIAGNGAILVDPFDVNEISNAMLELDLSNEIATYGLTNCKRFSWVNSSAETLKLIAGKDLN
jgi:glycosyltransferase involved in cell wall biosynthesis